MDSLLRYPSTFKPHDWCSVVHYFTYLVRDKNLKIALEVPTSFRDLCCELALGGGTKRKAIVDGKRFRQKIDRSWGSLRSPC